MFPNITHFASFILKPCFLPTIIQRIMMMTKAIFIFFPMLCGTKSRVNSWKFPYLLCSYFKLPERVLICKLRVTRSLSYFLHSFFILLQLVYYEQLVNISQYLSKTHYLLHKFYDTCIGRLYITFSDLATSDFALNNYCSDQKACNNTKHYVKVQIKNSFTNLLF